ncbi:hypothetical protein E2C01_085835 [Portunus trituberculatus]|uniref:Uncharacterized protein n=1 Tax=Portunus trituberculatus TaxID=210409 RepID=A0A5B7J3S4_PORTR|nr:hypothetical protein [Portunus trituberculatus]
MRARHPRPRPSSPSLAQPRRPTTIFGRARRGRSPEGTGGEWKGRRHEWKGSRERGREDCGDGGGEGGNGTGHCLQVSDLVCNL